MGLPVLVGSEGFLKARAIDGFEKLPIQKNSTATLVYVARDGKLLGAIDLGDKLRDDAAESVGALRDLGLTVELVSGDVKSAVSAVANELGIVAFLAQASPEDKSREIEHLRDINDAPALATADVGLAMGGGAEIALETAQAAILSNEPRTVAVAIRLSRIIMRTIKQNLFWAFAYNVVLVPLAAFGVVRPIFAAAAMGVSSLFVVSNSLLIRDRLK